MPQLGTISESASQLLKCYVEMVHSRVYTIKKRIQGDTKMASRGKNKVFSSVTGAGPGSTLHAKRRRLSPTHAGNFRILA